MNGPNSNSIGIISFKGGVGKTVSSINLAASLARLKKKVVVVDANFSSPSLHAYLGLFKPEKTLVDVLKKKGVEDAIYQYTQNLHIIPCSYMNKISLKKFSEKIKELKEHYDFVIIDSSPSLNEEMMAALVNSDELIFVTTPDYPTLLATLRAANLAKRRKFNIRGIIVNKKRNKKFELTRKDIEKTVGLKVIAEFGDDSRFIESSFNFVPLVDAYPKSKSAREYMKIASIVSGESVSEKKAFEKFYNSLRNLFKSDRQDLDYALNKRRI